MKRGLICESGWLGEGCFVVYFRGSGSWVVVEFGVRRRGFMCRIHDREEGGNKEERKT